MRAHTRPKGDKGSRLQRLPMEHGVRTISGETIRGLLVNIEDIRLHEDPVHMGPA